MKLLETWDTPMQAQRACERFAHLLVSWNMTGAYNIAVRRMPGGYGVWLVPRGPTPRRTTPIVARLGWRAATKQHTKGNVRNGRQFP